MNPSSSRLFEKMSKEEKEIFLNFQQRIQSSSNPSVSGVNSDITKKTHPELENNLPLTRDWSDINITIPVF